jgi:hypothetical protein
MGWLVYARLLQRAEWRLKLRYSAQILVDEFDSHACHSAGYYERLRLFLLSQLN